MIDLNVMNTVKKDNVITVNGNQFYVSDDVALQIANLCMTGHITGAINPPKKQATTSGTYEYKDVVVGKATKIQEVTTKDGKIFYRISPCGALYKGKGAEVVGKMGGDTITYRIYESGMVCER